MNRTLALTALCLTPATSLFAADDVSQQEKIDALEQRVAQLDQQLQEYRADQTDQGLSELRAAEIRDLVQDVLADSDQRASLLQGGASSGYSSGFYVGSADGNFKLVMNGQLQTRFVYSNQEETSGDSSRYGFEMRRTKLKFKGHVVDPSWQYFVNGAFSNSSGMFGLEEAGITKDLGNGWKITYGQVKLPFSREELVSSSKQLTVDRSLVNEEYNLDRSTGVQAHYSNDNFRMWAMISDGAGTRNTAALVEDTEIAFTGRVEWLAQGNSWGQFKDFTSFNGEETAILVGGGVHYQNGEYGTGLTEVERIALTGDVSLEFGGANVFAAVIWNSLDSVAIDMEQLGVVVQGGVFFNDDWEGFARFEWSDWDGGAAVEDLTVVTVGVNRYFSGHQVKWTTDIGFGIEEVSAPFASGGVGWRGDAVGDDGQIAVRSQLQLLF